MLKYFDFVTNIPCMFCVASNILRKAMLIAVVTVLVLKSVSTIYGLALQHIFSFSHACHNLQVELPNFSYLRLTYANGNASGIFEKVN